MANKAMKGSIALYDSEILIQRSKFRNNKADNGAALFGSSSCTEIAHASIPQWKREASIRGPLTIPAMNSLNGNNVFW